MEPERWRQINELFQTVVELDPAQRAAFLNQNCANDQELRSQIESLLMSDERDYELIEKPAVQMAAALIAQESPQLSAGQIVSHYEIDRLIGKGGMGEVYLAADKRLHRKIAIKLLPAEFTRDADRVNRFHHEAQAASSLNHPNILTIHEIGECGGQQFIATEFVDGETLRQRMERQPLNLGQALDIATQIAQALSAAHGAGIIHRDIKPENIMIRTDGYVKVLDFGLAKLADDRGATLKTFAATVDTAPGLILGTTRYMSPEQARGVTTDGRTDIWSLGVVLYEMLTGHMPFAAATSSDLMAAILTSQPVPASEYAPELPRELVRFVDKALRKDRDERHQTANDFSKELRQLRTLINPAGNEEGPNIIPATIAAQHPSHLPVAAPGVVDASDTQTVPELAVNTDASGLRASLGYIGASLKNGKLLIVAIPLAIVVLGAGVWKVIQANRSSPFPFTTNSRSSLRMSTLFDIKRKPNGMIHNTSFSPDGSLLAFGLGEEGRSSLYVKQISGGEPIEVVGGKAIVFTPIWSSDGQRIAFASSRDAKSGIWAVSYFGGEPVLLRTVDLPIGLYHLKKWSKDGRTIYYESRSSLYSLNLEDGATKLIASPDGATSGSMSVSPAEDSIAYVKVENDKEQIWIQSLPGGRPTPVVANNNHNWAPVWFPDGRNLAYSSDQNGNFQIYVLSLKDDLPVQVTFGDTNAESPIVSPDGLKIVYIANKDEANIYSFSLEAGKETPQTANVNLQLFPDVSPNGKQMAFQVTDDMAKMFASPLKIKSVGGDGETLQLESRGGSVKWSPNGETVAFLRVTGTLCNLFKMNIDDRKETQLTTAGLAQGGYALAPFDLLTTAFSWSLDGKHLAYSSKKSGQSNVWTISTDGSDEQMLTQNTESNQVLNSPLWAPDGQRIVYVSQILPKASGEKAQLWICVVEGSQSRTLFQTDSAIRLLGWSAPGTDIFFAIKDKTEVAVFKLPMNADAKPAQIARLADAHLNGIKLSPDGKIFAFSARRNGIENINLISVSGGPERPITANSDSFLFYSGVVWSPDANTVFYSKQTGGMQIAMISSPK